MSDYISSNILAVSLVFFAGIVLGGLIILKAHKQPDAAREALTKGFSSSKAAPEVSSRHRSVDSVEEKDGGMADIHRLLQNNQKIQAIKELRSQTGMGLAEAKEVIDRMCAEHRY